MDRHALLCLVSTALLLYAALADPPPGGLFKDLLIRGEVAADGGNLVVKSKSATFVLGGSNAAAYRVTAEVTLAAKGLPVLVTLMPSDPADLKKPALAQVSMVRDPAGRMLTLHTSKYDDTKTEVQQTGRFEADTVEELSLAVPTGKRGYHDLVVTLSNSRKRLRAAT